MARHIPQISFAHDHFEEAQAMKLFQIFRSNQNRRPAPKPYYRPAKIEALRFPQGLLAQSIR